jgi:hypothetical protein
MLSAAAAGTLKAGLNSILQSNVGEDYKKLARETLELANNQVRGHARDISSREMRNAYMQLPIAELEAMHLSKQLDAEGQAVLAEKVKRQQEQTKAEIEAAKGAADVHEAPVRKQKLEAETKKIEQENAEAPDRKREREAEIRLKTANALEAEARARLGPKPTERETQLDILTKSGAQAFERLAKFAKDGAALPRSAMALGSTYSKLDEEDAQTRRDVGLLTSLVLRNESGAVIGENEWDQRFNELGLNSMNEDIRRNALKGLLQSFQAMDRLKFLDSIDWSKDPPNAITSRILREQAAKRKAQETARSKAQEGGVAAEGQRGRGAGSVEPKNPLTEAYGAFNAQEDAAKLKLSEALRKGDPGKVRIYGDANEVFDAASTQVNDALGRGYSLTPKSPLLLEYYRGLRENKQLAKPAGGTR